MPPVETTEMLFSEEEVEIIVIVAVGPIGKEGSNTTLQQQDKLYYWFSFFLRVCFTISHKTTQSESITI